MIPKILHQLWFGSKPLPEREKKWCFELERLNAGWSYKLHGNEVLERYGQDPYVKSLLSQGEELAFVADRIRCLILAEQGGVYLDTDCAPHKPLDTFKFWDRSELDFAYGIRSPHREGVALWRGIALVDNSFLASAPNGRMINKILDLWKPNSPKVSGHRTGIQILSHTDENCVALNYRSFYDMQRTPETIVLHDPHNAGTWVKKKTDVAPL